MKNIPLILLTLILLSTACKKEKNEPEPMPNLQSAIQIALDGKTIEYSQEWGRIIDSGGTIFYGFQGISDSFTYWRPYNNQNTRFDSLYHSTILHTEKIHYISSSHIKLVHSRVFNSTTYFDTTSYFYTGEYDNGKYWVFSINESDTISGTGQVNFQVATSLDPFINFVKGSTIQRFFPWVSYYQDYIFWRQIYLPKNSADSVLFTYLGDTGYRHITSSYFAYYMTHFPNVWDTSLVMDTNTTNNKPYPQNHYKRFHGEDDALDSYNGICRIGVLK